MKFYKKYREVIEWAASELPFQSAHSFPDNKGTANDKICKRNRITAIYN